MKNLKAICNVKSGLYFTLCLIFPFISNLAFSQDYSVEPNVTRINLWFAGASASTEFKLGKTTTLFAEAGVNTYARVQTTRRNNWNVTNEEMVISVHPYFQVQPRLYYSLKRREKKGKNTHYNHGCFVALTGGYFFNSLNQDLFELDKRYFAGAVWGANIFMRGRFVFEVQIGAAYVGGTAVVDPNYEVVNQQILPITDLRFGFILNKRKGK